MKCEEIIDKLYLYEELNSAEKQMVDNHTFSCESCASEKGRIHRFQAIVDVVSNSKIEPLDSSALTDRIMSRVEREVSNPSRQYNWWPSFTGFNLVRLTLSIISLTLIISFGIEYSIKGNRHTISQVDPIYRPTTALNSGAFLKKFHAEEEGDTTFWEAFKAYKATNSNSEQTFLEKIKKYGKDE